MWVQAQRESSRKRGACMNPEQCLINRCRNELLDLDCEEQSLAETAQEIVRAVSDYLERPAQMVVEDLHHFARLRNRRERQWMRIRSRYGIHLFQVITGTKNIINYLKRRQRQDGVR